MDWKSIVDLVILICTLLTAYFTARAAWQARRAVQEAVRGTTRNEQSSRKMATIRHLNSCSDDYIQVPKKIKSLDRQLSAPAIAEDKKQTIEERRRTELERLFRIWEHIAAGINAGVYDIEVFNQMTGSRCVGQYTDHSEFVRRRRREESLRIYDQLDIVIDRLLEMRFSKHLVTDNTLQRLAAHFVDSETIQGVAGLKGIVYHNYKQLSAALAERGVEREKNLVFAFSRQRCFSIVRCEKNREQDVIALFRLVQEKNRRDYDYSWPPTTDTLEQTVFGKKTHIRNYVVLYREPGDERRAGGHLGSAKAQVAGFVALQELEKEEDIDHWGGKLGQDWEKKAFSTDGARQGRGLRDLVVIRRFAVHPSYAKTGLARITLRHAIRTIQELDTLPKADSDERGRPTSESTRVPIALIPRPLKEALRLCGREGGRFLNDYEDPKEGKLEAFVF